MDPSSRPTLGPGAPAGFALNQADVDEFKAIVLKECGVRMDNHEAWNRVIELLNLYRALLGPIPEDPEAKRAAFPVRTLSHLPATPSS
jgi:hypothetical protein